MIKKSTAPWVTVTPDYRENINNMPEEMWRPYINQYVVYSLDGREILAGADTNEELREIMAAKGIDSSRVVFSHVDDPDVSYIGPFK